MQGKLHWQTKRYLTPRLKEHHFGNKTGTPTDVIKHLLENPSHVINFNKPEIIFENFIGNQIIVLCESLIANSLEKEKKFRS